MEFKTCEIEYRDIDADERVIIRANPFVVYKMMPLLQPFFEEGEVIRLQRETRLLRRRPCFADSLYARRLCFADDFLQTALPVATSRLSSR